jgi:hypothetical protein
LNQRLKELQSALEEAKTEQEREEIRRRLKRLREQQQEILRDTDQLRQRMQRPENQRRMAESRRNLDQTREQIRQTTEALQQGQVSRAVASGTRAERQLRQMREEFRRQASGRFSEELRQLRDEARKLNENETELARQLRGLDQPQPKTSRLRDPSRREQLQKGFTEQRDDLERLLENVRQTVEEAEETEPLMTQKLYDTLRKARQQRLDDALDVTRSMLDRGLLDQARQAESQAGRGIQELKEGVEQAAESVLGDENEALRRARQMLEDLADELNEEIRRADPKQQAPRRLADRTKPPQVDRGRNEPSDQQRRAGQPGTDQQRNVQPAEQRSGQPNEQQANPGRPNDASKPSPEQSDRPSRNGTPRRSVGQPAGQPADQRPRQPRPRSLLRDGGRDGRPDSNETPSEDRLLTPDGLPQGPITGDDFLNWSDRLRDVEEMIDDPDMRADAARIRDAAGGIRRQLRGGSQGPNWDLVREFVAEPLCELRDRVAEELLRRGDPQSMVPIDRDAVPSKYVEQVRRYYEELGRGAWP